MVRGGPRGVAAGVEVSATVGLVYADFGLDYSPLQEGVHFDVVEGSTIVARGVVVRRFESDRRPLEWPATE